jgi:predicted N-acyltransferase
LTQAFFEEIFQTMKERIVLFLARSGGKPVAAALHFQDADALFGRYWGCFHDFKFLHFELCYYGPIQYAIERKLRLFEAGAGGEHKIQRGFVPTLTYSAHWIRHSGFRKAIARFVEEEKALVARYVAGLKEHLPYK